MVSDFNGELEFNRSRTDNPSDLSYSGSIKKPKEHLNEWPFIKFDDTIKVNSTTLDKYCEDNDVDIIDFIWADVQGAEKNLIDGGSGMLKNGVRFLYTEYSNKEYYEGQVNLAKLSELLGDDWELVQDFNTDALFKNKNI